MPFKEERPKQAFPLSVYIKSVQSYKFCWNGTHNATYSGKGTDAVIYRLAWYIE